MKWTWLIGIGFRFTDGKSSRPIEKEEIIKLREATREMLNHAFDGYINHAYPKVRIFYKNLESQTLLKLMEKG